MYLQFPRPRRSRHGQPYASIGPRRIGQIWRHGSGDMALRSDLSGASGFIAAAWPRRSPATCAPCTGPAGRIVAEAGSVALVRALVRARSMLGPHRPAGQTVAFHKEQLMTRVHELTRVS